MKTLELNSNIHWCRQRGVAAVEFALVAALFFTLMIGIMEMGRLLFYWNSAAEATRLGARIAVVCDLNDAAIKSRMQTMLSILPPDGISISYEPSGCNVDNCNSVTVSILPTVPIATFIPYVPLSLTLPSFSTTLPRESMLSTIGGQTNPACM
jgi:Flp pilus assembly protein TadG